MKLENKVETFTSTTKPEEMSNLATIALLTAQPFPQPEVGTGTVTLGPDNPLVFDKRFVDLKSLDILVESTSFDWEAEAEHLMDEFDEAWRRLADL